jgi:hypothetical protein
VDGTCDSASVNFKLTENRAEDRERVRRLNQSNQGEAPPPLDSQIMKDGKSK